MPDSCHRWIIGYAEPRPCQGALGTILCSGKACLKNKEEEKGREKEKGGRKSEKIEREIESYIGE